VNKDTGITDLVLAILVFIFFLLAAWGLHCIGNILGMTWFRFFWQVFELLFISFVTLLCARFFVRGIVKVIKELRTLHLKGPIKQQQVASVSFQLSLRDVTSIITAPLISSTSRFVTSITDRPLGHVVCSILVSLILYVGISFGLVRDNCDDVSLFACELMCETGPDFTKPIAGNDFATILGSYAKYMENKHLAVLLWAFPSYTPKQVFADVNDALGRPKATQEEAANDIWRAGEKIMLFRLKAPNFLPRGIVLHESRKATELLVPLAAEALVNSIKALEDFNHTPTMENAVRSCERNRLTMLLLFPLRSSYDAPQVTSLFVRFRAVVEECRKSKINVANRIKDDNDPRKKFLTEIIARSEQRRLGILDDIKERNMQGAIERMWDAIEIAYDERDTLLTLCARIRDAGNYSEEIIIPLVFAPSQEFSEDYSDVLAQVAGLASY